jgi:hypothetical protein
LAGRKREVQSKKDHNKVYTQFPQTYLLRSKIVDSSSQGLLKHREEAAVTKSPPGHTHTHTNTLSEKKSKKSRR